MEREMTAKFWKHKGGTAGRECNCGSWKQHWINNSGLKWPNKCSINGCSNDATDGAHVINDNETGEWIVPTCASCNNKKNDVFDIKGGVTLVRANKSLTCEK